MILGRNDFEDWMLANMVDPASLIKSMTVPEFRSWLRLDEYGNPGDYKKDVILSVLNIINGNTDMYDYEMEIYEILKNMENGTYNNI